MSVVGGLASLARIGGAIGLGTLAADLEVGAHAVTGLEYGARAAAGLGAAYAAGQYIRRRSQVSDPQKMDLQLVGYKRRHPSRGGVTSTYNDPGSYRQLASVKRRYGRKLRARSYQYKILKSVFTSIRQRYANLSAINAANGKVFIANQTGDVGDTFKFLPIHIAGLFNCNQGNAADGTQLAPPVLYSLSQESAGTGEFFWRKINGLASDGTTARGSFEQIGPGDNVNAIIGRKGMLAWTRIRMCIWAKKQNPTNVRISLVKFMEPEFCPEFTMNFATGTSTAITQDARDLWQQRVKPLLVGPISNQPTAAPKGIKVIKRWNINMNPIDAAAETAGSDPRGHMRHIDLFHRWNREVDFTTKLSTENNETYTTLTQAANTAIPSTSYNGTLRHFERNVYLLIESVSPNLEAFGATDATKSALTASYDINIENSWGHMQKF